MPLLLDTPASVDRVTARTDTIEIALLNNLGDGGLEGGERQIVELLTTVAGPNVVRLRFFSLPQIARGPRARTRIESHYTPFADLMQSRVDGLIVTGCEPRADKLPDEPFWPALAEVVDWAEHHTRSTIWSCLAAHAAVLHLDGIARRRLPGKCSGIFPIHRAGEHPLLAGARDPLVVPHSRFNALDEHALVASGYEILTRSDTVGVDTFVKQWRSLFVYFQGHPEYDSAALAGEYRRDVLRFMAGASPHYPDLPHDYFAPDLAAALHAYAEAARHDRETDREFPLGRRSSQVKPWRRAFATVLLRNWLRYLQTKAVDRAA